MAREDKTPVIYRDLRHLNDALGTKIETQTDVTSRAVRKGAFDTQQAISQMHISFLGWFDDDKSSRNEQSKDRAEERAQRAKDRTEERSERDESKKEREESKKDREKTRKHEKKESDDKKREKSKSPVVKAGTKNPSGVTGGIGKKAGKFKDDVMGKLFGRGILAKAGVFGMGAILSDSIGKGIMSLTDNPELAAAGANIVKFGALGSLFGKKYALIGAVAGAMATEENMEVLRNIGEGFSDRVGEFNEYLLTLGVDIPKIMDGAMSTLEERTTQALKSAQALVEGDMDALQNNAQGSSQVGAIMASQAVKGKTLQSMAKNALTKPETPASAVKPPAMNKQERIQLNNKTASNLSQKKLDKLKDKGITVDKGGMRQNGKFMSADKMDEALKSVKAPTSTQSKGLLKQLAQFKNLKAALKIPVLGTMISAGSIGMIMANDELSKEEKMAQIAGALGGIGGGLLGTIAGATVGSVVPLLGTGVGGLLGGVLGAMSGDYIASQVAQWLLGEESELIGVAKSLQEANKSGGAVSTAQSVTGTPGGDAIAKGIAKALPTQGGQVAQSTQTLNELLSGNSGSALFAPTSNTSNVSNNTSLVSSSLNSFDISDPFIAGTRV